MERTLDQKLVCGQQFLVVGLIVFVNSSEALKKTFAVFAVKKLGLA